jgi:hypothetical protein
MARLVGIAEHADTGVVDQHVHRAEVPFHGLGRFGEAGAVGYIQRHEQRLFPPFIGKPARGQFAMGLVAIAERQPQAGIAERLPRQGRSP